MGRDWTNWQDRPRTYNRRNGLLMRVLFSSLRKLSPVETPENPFGCGRKPQACKCQEEVKLEVTRPSEPKKAAYRLGDRLAEFITHEVAWPQWVQDLEGKLHPSTYLNLEHPAVRVIARVKISGHSDLESVWIEHVDEQGFSAGVFHLVQCQTNLLLGQVRPDGSEWQDRSLDAGGPKRNLPEVFEGLDHWGPWNHGGPNELAEAAAWAAFALGHAVWRRIVDKVEGGEAAREARQLAADLLLEAMS